MSTALLWTVVAVAWSGAGLVVALILGRFFRNAGAAPDEAANRLIC